MERKELGQIFDKAVIETLTSYGMTTSEPLVETKTPILDEIMSRPVGEPAIPSGWENSRPTEAEIKAVREWGLGHLED